MVIKIKIAITLRYEKINNRELYIINQQFEEIFEKLNITLVPILDIKNAKETAINCDALILTGSPIHVNPKLYGEEEKINYEWIYEKEDELDYKIIKEFTKLNKPILGICRGLQIINVYYGGTLNQKINNHEGITHLINIEKNSFLKNIYKEKCISVNSTHTQSINKLAKNFKICAQSNDGTIEAIQKEYIYAVQWHPEKLLDYSFFKWFISIL